MLDLSEFPIDQSPFYLYPEWALSRILFTILGSACEKGALELRELTCAGVIKENYGQILTWSPLAQVKNFDLWRFHTLSPFIGLRCASFFEIAEVAASLIEMECYDINEVDFSGCGRLAWTARNGHEGVINPDKSDNTGWTPLSHAAWDGHEWVINIPSAGRDQPRQAKSMGRNTALWCRSEWIWRSGENTTRAGRGQSRQARW